MCCNLYNFSQHSELLSHVHIDKAYKRKLQKV